MNRCMFTVGKRGSKGITAVYLKDGGAVVGWMCEMWGKGAGWFWRIPNSDWSSLPLRTQKSAILAIGECRELKKMEI